MNNPALTLPSNVDPKNVEDLIRFFDHEVFDKGNVDLVDAMISDDFVNHDPIPGQPLGKGGVKVAAQQLKIAFPDWSGEQELVIGKNDMVSHRIRWSGTFTNDFMGFKAHGGRISVLSHDYNRFQDGQIVERWCVFDTPSFIRQLAGGQDPDSVREVGEKAYAAFKRWAETGEVEPFLSCLADDATLIFSPAPPPHNTLQVGKAAIERHLRLFSDELKLRVKHEPKPGMLNGNSYAVELDAIGVLDGEPRTKKLLTVLDIHNVKVIALREYGA